PAPWAAQPHARRIENRDPPICVNVIVGLIKVTCYLLDQQLRRLEEDFLREGGLRAHGSCSARRSRQTGGNAAHDFTLSSFFSFRLLRMGTGGWEIYYQGSPGGF